MWASQFAGVSKVFALVSSHQDRLQDPSEKMQQPDVTIATVDCSRKKNKWASHLNVIVYVESRSNKKKCSSPLLSEMNVETLQDLSASLDSCFHLFFRTKERPALWSGVPCLQARLSAGLQLECQSQPSMQEETTKRSYLLVSMFRHGKLNQGRQEGSHNVWYQSPYCLKWSKLFPLTLGRFLAIIPWCHFYSQWHIFLIASHLLRELLIWAIASSSTGFFSQGPTLRLLGVH